MGVAGGPKPQTSWYQVYQWSAWNDVGSFSYDIDNSASVPSFSRILYIFAVGDSSVWIELDDFTSNTANRTGVPLTWTYEVNVTNLVVKFKKDTFTGADNDTIYNRFNGVNGRINFWPSNYGTSGENDSLYDSDDSGYSSSNGYGSMQFFDVSQSPSHCIFSWSYWGNNIFGMGNRNTASPDWTFANNGASILAEGNKTLGQVWIK